MCADINLRSIVFHFCACGCVQQHKKRIDLKCGENKHEEDVREKSQKAHVIG